jgi:hypothetical protein
MKWKDSGLPENGFTVQLHCSFSTILLYIVFLGLQYGSSTLDQLV